MGIINSPEIQELRLNPQPVKIRLTYIYFQEVDHHPLGETRAHNWFAPFPEIDNLELVYSTYDRTFCV